MATTLHVPIKTVVDDATAKKLRNLAKREASSESRIVRLALRDYLAKHA